MVQLAFRFACESAAPGFVQADALMRPATATDILVLVVSPDPVLGRVLKLSARSAHRIENVLNPSSAHNEAVRLRPQLLVIDAGLEDVGWRIVAGLRAEPVTSGIPIVGVLAADDRQVQEALAAGCTTCLKGALDARELGAVLLSFAPAP